MSWINKGDVVVSDVGLGGHDSAELPPIAVFCDPDGWGWPGEPANFAHAGVVQVLAALEQVEPFAPLMRRLESLAGVGRALTSLGEAIEGPDSAFDAVDVAPQSPVQSYFRIRTAKMTWSQMATVCCRLGAQSIGDIGSLPVAGSDIARMCTGFRQIVVDLFGEPLGFGVIDQRTMPDAPAQHIRHAQNGKSGVRGAWFNQWILGHHLHAMFNVMATVAIQDSIAAWGRGDIDGTTQALVRATRYVESFPACRSFALALPSDFYNSVLRPSMLPPLTASPLTGKMHVEYLRYRQRFEGLLEVIPQSITELARVQPSVALARESLIEADLLDSHRHVSLVEPLVGAQKSLVQSVRVSANAVSALQLIHNRRAARYAKFLRFPVVSTDRSD